jgi:hypothetical protein
MVHLINLRDPKREAVGIYFYSTPLGYRPDTSSARIFLLVARVAGMHQRAYFVRFLKADHGPLRAGCGHAQAVCRAGARRNAPDQPRGRTLDGNSLGWTRRSYSKRKRWLPRWWAKFRLQPMSFEIYRGECVALFGPTGSGKSLLLALDCGRDRVGVGHFGLCRFCLQDMVGAVELRIVEQNEGYRVSLSADDTLALRLLREGYGTVRGVYIREPTLADAWQYFALRNRHKIGL